MLTSELVADTVLPGGESEPCKSGGQDTSQGEQRHGKDLKFGGVMF